MTEKIYILTQRLSHAGQFFYILILKSLELFSLQKAFIEVDTYTFYRHQLLKSKSKDSKVQNAFCFRLKIA